MRDTMQNAASADVGGANARREKFQKDLQSLQQKRDLLAVDVPVDLLRAIDEGGNPDAFTAQIFERANRANQLSKGKAEAFAIFRCYPVTIAACQQDRQCNQTACIS